MINKIILIRHGESEKDKTNPNRNITTKGIKQIRLSSIKIKRVIKNENSLIICSNTLRTKNSGQIISEKLGLDLVVSKSNLRVQNIQLLERKKRVLLLDYFESFQKGTLPKSIPSPIKVANRFLMLVKKYSKYESLIIVGNSGGLESFITYQKKFIPDSPFKRELKYGEFVVLKRKK